MLDKYKLAGECFDANGQFLGRYIYLWHPSQQKELDAFCLSWLKTYETDNRFFLSRDYECLVGDTLVTLSNGKIVQLQDFQPSYIMGSDFGPNYKSINTFVKGDMLVNKGVKEVFRIFTRYGCPIEASANHAFLTQRGWVKVKDLLENDSLLHNRKISDFPENKSISDIELSLLGWYIAEGCRNRDGFHISIVEKEYVHDFIESHPIPNCEWVIGHNNSIRLKFLGCTGRDVDGNYIKSPGRRLLESHNLFLKYSWEKSIPEDVLKSSNKQLKIFLRSLFTGDGSVHKARGQIVYTTTSKLLAKQLVLVLARFGIICSWHECSDNRKACYRDNFKLTIEGEDANIFCSEIGFWGRKQTELEKSLNKKSQNQNKHRISLEDSRILLNRLKQLADTPTKFYKKFGLHVDNIWYRPARNSVSLVSRIQAITQDPVLEKILSRYSNDFIYSPIRKIVPVGDKEVFDITTSTHQFIADNYIVHNTQGKIPNLGKVILSCVAWDKHHALVFFPENFDLTLWKKVLNTIPTINQNQKFDFTWEMHHWGVKPINKLCTLHSAKVAYAGLITQYNLASLCKIIGDGLIIDKEIRSDFITMQMEEKDGIFYGIGGTSDLTDDHVSYGARDALVNFRIAKKIVDRLIEQDLWEFYQEVEHPLDLLFAEEELKGIKVDWDLVGEYWAKGKEELLNYREVLDSYLSHLTEGDKKRLKFTELKNPPGTPRGTPKQRRFNPKAGPQIVNVLNNFGIKVRSTEKEELHALKASLIDSTKSKDQETFKFVEALIDYKAQSDYISKYVQAWFEKYLNPVTGNIHPSFQSIASKGQTGRMAASEPNVMAITGDFRPVVLPSSDTRVLLCKDYSGFEFRAAAGQSGEVVLLNAFNRRAEMLPLLRELVHKYGETDPDDFVKAVIEKKKIKVTSSEEDLCKEFMCVDIHRQNGAMIFNKDPFEITGELRQVSKTIGYLSLYAGSASRLQQSLSEEKIYYSWSSCEKILKIFNERLGSLAKFQKDLKAAVFNPGWVATPLGRKKYAGLPSYKPRNYNEIVASTEREFINFPQQGANVDALKLSMIELNQYFKDNYEPQVRPRCLIPVHDELVVDCEAEHAPIIDPIMGEVMERYGRLSINNTCPIECSSKMGNRWMK